MAIDVQIPQSGAAPAGEAPAATKGKKATVPQQTLSSQPLDLDALLKRIQETKPETGKGRAPGAATTQISENVLALLKKAKEGGIERLQLGATVKAVAVALGVDAGKKSQYFYTLSQSVLKILGDKVELVKEGRNVLVSVK